MLRENGKINDFKTQFLRANGGYDWILLSCRIITLADDVITSRSEVAWMFGNPQVIEAADGKEALRVAANGVDFVISDFKHAGIAWFADSKSSANRTTWNCQINTIRLAYGLLR